MDDINVFIIEEVLFFVGVKEGEHVFRAPSLLVLIDEIAGDDHSGVILFGHLTLRRGSSVEIRNQLVYGGSRRLDVDMLCEVGDEW